MRIYATFDEAHNEIRRDLAELAIVVQPETMQHFDVADNPDFLTHELPNYGYQVLSPRVQDVPDLKIEYTMQEWQDRLEGGLNPGNSWKLRADVWEEMLEDDGKFAYTYSERMGGNYIRRIIHELGERPHSRQLWLPVWHPIDESRRGKRRVPCSLGYWLVNRNGYLHLTYMMRSCDLITHWPQDVALATLLQTHIAQSVQLQVGTFTHNIGSFHVYRKDVEGVF